MLRLLRLDVGKTFLEGEFFGVEIVEKHAASNQCFGKVLVGVQVVALREQVNKAGADSQSH